MTEEEKKAIEYFNKRLTIEKYTKNIGTPVYIKDIETILNLINKQQKETEKKNKMIDEMAEHIVSSAIVDDTVCAIKCDCETDIFEDCTHEKMLNCTKQYFENKVEGE